MLRSRHLAVLVSLVLLAAASAADSDWAGKRVVLKQGHLKIFDTYKDQRAEVGEIPVAVIQVLQEQEGWLKVRCNGVEGWFEKVEAVLLDDAVAYYTDYIRLRPGEAFGYGMRGIVHNQKGDYDQAIHDHTEAIRLDPQDAVNRYNRAISYSNKKDYDSAIDDYSVAIRLQPKYASAFDGRGSAWRAKKDLDKALNDYNQAILLDPSDPRTFENRGFLWSDKREFDKAIADYSEAMRLDPQDANFPISRGNAWYAKRDYDKALADYDQAIRLDPKEPVPYRNRGLVWAQKREYDKAIEQHSEAIRLNPNYSDAYLSRGNAHDKKKAYDLALADYQAAVRASPKDPWPHKALAWFLATCPDDKCRDGKKAVEHGKQACELSAWKEPTFIDALAAAFAEAGDFEQAVAMEKKALGFPEYEIPYGVWGRARLREYQAQKPYRGP